MKKLSIFASYVLILVLVISFSACEKIFDRLPDFHGKKDCRIKKIIHYGFGGPYAGVFYYNQWGDPDSVIYERVFTGEPNFRFIYDHKKRLREAYALYSSNLTYERWHKYGYINKKQIITDTFFTFGIVGADPESTPYTGRSISYLQYDEYGRIIYDSIHTIYPAGIYPVIKRYEYDRYGNLVRPGYVYDNNVNLHQLHPIWKFMDRDYSINNPVKAVEYNEYRLPVRFDIASGYPFLYTFLYETRPLDKSYIEYDCK